MKKFGFVGRILRRLIWEVATDNTTGLAAQMAYQFLFTLAPGLLFLWHLLGLFGTDPARLHQMLGVLKAFLPADPKVQEILDTQVASVVVTGTGGTLVSCDQLSETWGDSTTAEPQSPCFNRPTIRLRMRQSRGHRHQTSG